MRQGKKKKIRDPQHSMRLPFSPSCWLYAIFLPVTGSFLEPRPLSLSLSPFVFSFSFSVFF